MAWSLPIQKYLFQSIFVVICVYNIKMSKKVSIRLLEDDLPQVPSLPSSLSFQKANSMTVGVDWSNYDYKEYNNQAKLHLSKFTLMILSPLLLVSHRYASSFLGLPIVQYVFVTLLLSFIYNYIFVIRRHELYPFLKDPALDKRLKTSAALLFVGFLVSVFVGWNGSGGLLFAIYWQSTRGVRIGTYGIYFGLIIAGSLVMEKTFNYTKLLQLIPGLIVGYVSGVIFNLKGSNFYTLSHAFLFLFGLGLPVILSAVEMRTPDVTQTGGLLLCSLLMYLSVLLLVKTMQCVRVSVVLSLSFGLLMAVTTVYSTVWDSLSLGAILVGMFLIIRAEFDSLQ